MGAAMRVRKVGATPWTRTTTMMAAAVLVRPCPRLGLAASRGGVVCLAAFAGGSFSLAVGAKSGDLAWSR